LYDGNVYVVGRTYGALPTQTKTSLLEDAFIRKYDASGSELWTRQFGTPTSSVGPSNGTTAQGVAVDSTGVYVVGTAGSNFPGQTNAGSDDAFIRKYDASGNVLWTHQFGGDSYDGASGVAVERVSM